MHVTGSVRTAAATLGVAALSFLAGAAPDAGDGRADPVLSVNLHRVRVLLGGDVRAVWIGDSWCRLSRSDRLPFGAIATWPGLHVAAVGTGFKGGGTLTSSVDYTSGPGQLENVNHQNSWSVELNGGVQAHFALPLNDLTRLYGHDDLRIPQTGPDAHRISLLRVSNPGWRVTEHGPFSDEGDRIRARVWYYAPRFPHDMVDRLLIRDVDGVELLSLEPSSEARALWSLGENPDSGLPSPAQASQMNAAYTDVAVSPSPGAGPGVVIAEDPGTPLAGSEQWLFFGGASFYKEDSRGQRIAGYYHSGLAQDSWSIAGLGDDIPSSGGKSFSDEQLTRWLDVTTLDRSQRPIVILHVATEPLTESELLPLIQRVLRRYRAAFGAIGTVPPRFLLVGSYMHEIRGKTLVQSRSAVEALNRVYASLAAAEPDCAYFSLYHATEGVFFTSDEFGGPGAQQAAKDWLIGNGWSQITFGGKTYNLAGAEDGGLDGVLVDDGLHLASLPAAAFYAKLLGNALAAADCPADFNADGLVDSRDVLAFVNAWISREPDGDFDGDGAWTTMDLLAFLNTWNDSCL